MRTGLILTLGTLLLAGCGSSGATATPTLVALASYHDPLYGFSFRYPSNWSVSKSGGHVTKIGNVSTYIVDVSVPNDKAQVSITMDRNVQPFPAFQNGKTAPDPNGPTHTFQYFHGRMAGWPAMDIRRYTGKQISERDTIANTRTRSYDVRALTVNPPFSSEILNGYATIVSTLKVPFA